MRHYLKRGTKVKEYTVVAKLGEGASCVAYSCVDSSDRNVILKEYYPLALKLDRNDSNSIVCDEKELERFNQGLERYKQSIERQIKFRSGMGGDNNIVNQIFDVSDQFAWNGTYYAVMTAYTGKNFSQIESMPLYDRIRVCKSIAQYVEKCHNAGFLCLDIKPDNIFVLPETPEFPMFFDFDSMVSKEEAQKGYNLSFSERWAAPEQLIPGEYSKISEATDIYALGELVFWCVFGRNSRDEEHREYSKYLFGDSLFPDLILSDTRKMFSDFFLHTIRNLPRKRFQEVKDVIDAIEQILPELNPLKRKLLPSLKRNSNSFFGRETELREINSILSENHLVILSGIGGIGKSELARYYAEKSEKYDMVIYLSYETSLVDTIANNQFISNMDQYDNENEEQFCERKMHVLSELCNEKTLLILDNLDINIDEIEQQDVWKKIISLPSDILVTTRCNQGSYRKSQISVNELSLQMLERIFYSICPCDSNQREYVQSIIQSFGNHTLLVVMMSKNCKTKFLSPEELLAKLRNNGITSAESFSDENVKKVFSDIFPVMNLSRSSRELLYCISLMPRSGFRVKDFLLVFPQTNTNDLRELVNQGWIYEENDEVFHIVMHPVIYEAVTSQLANDKEFAGELFRTIKEDYSKEAVQTSREQITKQKLGREQISKQKLVGLLLDKCIFLHIEIEDLADVIFLYCIAGQKTLSANSKVNYLQKAVQIYDECYAEAYSEKREVVAFFLLSALVEMDEPFKADCLAQQHAKISKQFNCYGTSLSFYLWDLLNFTYISTKKRGVKIWISCWFTRKKNMGSFIVILFSFFAEYLKLKKLNKEELIGVLNKLNIHLDNTCVIERLCEIDEDDIDEYVKKMVFRMMFIPYDVADLKNWMIISAKESRNHAGLSVVRSIIAHIFVKGLEDKTIRLYRKIGQDLCLGLYGRAETNISRALSLYQMSQIVDARLLDVHKALGQLCLIKHRYDEAQEEFLKCLELYSYSNSGNPLDIHMLLAYSYLLDENLTESESAVQDIDDMLITSCDSYESKLRVAFLKGVMELSRNKVLVNADTKDLFHETEKRIDNICGFLTNIGEETRPVWEARIDLLRIANRVYLGDFDGKTNLKTLRKCKKVFKKHLTKKSLELQKCKEIIRLVKNQR